MARFVLLAFFAALLTHAEVVSWRIETVDQTGQGRYSSLKIDKDGNAHLAYVTETGDDHLLKYAVWDHTVKRWFAMTIDRGASFSSLTLDSKGNPHISYADYGTGVGAKLRYAHWDGKTWQKQAIPLNSEVIAYYTSIALDATDSPSISFYEYRGPRGTEISVRMRVVTWSGDRWQVRTVDGQNQSGKFNYLLTDAKNNLHLAYANVGAMTAGMRYSFWDGKMWSNEIVEDASMLPQSYLGQSAAMAVDGDGNPHLTYVNASPPSVRYAVRQNGRWKVQLVDNVAAIGYPDRNSIAVDSEGHPYISYYDAGAGALKLARRLGSRWQIEIIDNNGAGFTSSLQLTNNAIWISYSDDANGSVKVARSDLLTTSRSERSSTTNGQQDSH